MVEMIINTVQVLYFEYKTYLDQVFKIKHTDQRIRKSNRKNRYI